ncbi:TetR/AcrR family transcriptional regulator [Dialister micraerophilus]|uniref:Transcriptional regulator, TetR family n=1 Tax=Dialister micraerophilus UPII 345-E TaxID=910314 RepID=E4LAR3_9FIRM|nr:TetR/AcrR family transcriptional regulator [Dialister micraerophilus]EFR42124.1 transcriptional regulator, TetR family [Dialister micraerophilus UPII 345-E]
MRNKELTEKGEKIKQKIIDVTSRILRNEGFKKATIRRIAKECNTNIASVNYYFGSKEELIGAALEKMIFNFEAIVSYLDKTDLPVKERLRKYILGYFKLAHQHPALFRSISSPSSNDAKDTYFIYLNLLHDQSWDKFLRNVGELSKINSQPDLEMKCMQVFSAMEYPIIVEINRKNSFLSKYIKNDEQLEKYVEILLQSIEHI